MAKTTLTHGLRWARLRCVGVRSVRENTVGSFEGYKERHVVYYDLKCDCGKTVAINSGEFPGKRVMRDCGCGIGGKRFDYVDIKVRIARDVLEIAQSYIEHEGGTMSMAVESLMRKGWDKYGDEIADAAEAAGAE